MSGTLDTCFQQACISYPKAFVSGQRPVPGILGEDEEDEIMINHTWQLVDAEGASFRDPARHGMLVLRENRPGCREPFHHWGYMISKQELTQR